MPAAVNGRARLYTKEEIAEQVEQCFLLFAQRKSKTDIRRITGLSPVAIDQRIQQGIRQASKHERDTAVRKDLRLIDATVRRLCEIIEHGEAELAIKASNALMAALKRRAAMLGYDAPTNILVAGSVEVKATVDHRISAARDLLRAEATRGDIAQLALDSGTASDLSESAG